MAASAAETQFWFVIDDSGSMCSYQAEVRSCVQALVKASSCHAHFVCFSNGAQYGTDLASIRYAGGGTDICAGFSCLNQQVLMQLPLPSKIVVVFISDGEDYQASTVNSRLKSLGGTIGLPGVKTVLFTVAVGRGFPTNMVVEALRPNYHNCSDYLPLVFPVDAPSECKEAFQQLSSYMFEVDHDSTSGPQVDETSSQASLEAAATAIYNYHVLRATREQDKDKALVELRAGKPELERIAKIIQDRDDRLTGELGPAKKVDVLKPLVSQRLAKYKQERASGLTVVRTLTEQLNKLINDTMAGKVLARLSDAELALALGYGNRAGRHLAKSLKYNSAEFDQSKSSLVQYLRGYTPEQAAADAQLVDYIVTQEECISDAKERVDDIAASSINSIVSLVDVMAIMGRTIKIKTSDGVQINPWLVEVVGMPHVMKLMNSVDFFGVHQGSYQDPHRNEEANCLLPITTGSASILREYVGQHLTTFFLARNEALCFPQALGSLIAATITYCLSLPQPMPAWAKEEVAQALTTYECVYVQANGKGAKGLGNKYLDRLASASEWRKCLVTEDPQDSSTKCEHLTKFILGLMVLINTSTERSSAGWTSQRLREYMVATMTEMAGRAVERSKDVTSYFGNVPHNQSVEQLLSEVPMDAALQALTLSEATTLYQKAVSAVVTMSHPGVAVKGTKEEMIATLGDLGVSHYQFNESVITTIFENLDSLAGNSTPPSGFFRLTPAERLSILAHAHTHASSADRCNTELQAYDASTLVQDLVSRHMRAVVAGAPERVTSEYTQRMWNIHLGIVMHFPRGFTERYQSETGRDVEGDLAINEETRLPRNCCVAVGCPCFLQRCKPTLTPEGKPRMSDQLLNHLAAGGITPAYTRCLVGNMGKDAEEVAQKILACEALLPCDDGTRNRALKNTASWCDEVSKLETLPTTSVSTPGPVTLATLVKADMEAFEQAEQLWGGYEAFKRAMDERVYKGGEGLIVALEE